MSKKNKILHIDNEQHLKKIFVNIYEENFERLIRYAFSITKEKGLAEDVVSQVFANLWDKKDRLHKIREVRFYLNTSVRNQAIKKSQEFQLLLVQLIFKFSQNQNTIQTNASLDLIQH